MIRTRDFSLFLLTVLFLVGGISVSSVRGISLPGTQSATLYQVADEGTLASSTLIATAPEVTVPDRSSKLALMREKIAALGEILLPSSPLPEIAIDQGTTNVAELVVEGEEPPAAAWDCSEVRSVSLPPLLGVSFKEVEGARIVYREGLAQDSVTMATTTNTPIPLHNDIVLLQLPLRVAPAASPSCLPYDIIGIAMDGSPINNDEQSVYSVFGGSTIVGYALDGFPIYGRADDIVADRCGGAFVGGTYRYYLSSERAAVLGCFAGVPVTL